MNTQTQEPKAAPGSARRNAKRIAEEHKILGETLKRLEATTDPRLLLECLEDFRGQLERHFANEEGHDGLEEVVGKPAPHLLGSVEEIFDEHRQFLTSIDDLIARTKVLVADPMTGILRDVEALAGRLREHEERETELVSDAIYTDLGQGD